MKKTILVIDDSASVRQMVSFTLKNEGNYSVVAVENGKEALNFLRGRKPDLIICDLYMPEIDGLEFIRTIRGMPELRTLPVIILTTETKESARREAKVEGVFEWLVKPVSPEGIVAAVKRAI